VRRSEVDKLMLEMVTEIKDKLFGLEFDGASLYVDEELAIVAAQAAACVLYASHVDLSDKADEEE